MLPGSKKAFMPDNTELIVKLFTNVCKIIYGNAI